MPHSPKPLVFLFAAFLLAWGVCDSVRAQGDEVSITFAPSSEEVPACPGVPLEVEVQLSNPAGLTVGGYQIFLRFPALHFEAVRYEAPEQSGFLAVEGPAPLGGGYQDCDQGGTDRWSDRAGDDVVSVVATFFGDANSGPMMDDPIDLGRFIFRTIGAVPGGEGVPFSSNVEACRNGFDTATRVFGAQGQALPMSEPEPFTVSVVESGPTLSGLFCADLGQAVRLTWSRPEGGQYSGFRIYRDGESLAQLLIPGFFEWTDNDPPQGSIHYEVAVLMAGAREGCRASCTVDRESGTRFLRGDANRDTQLNISDAISVLGHLFRGVPITCLDAGDFDDSGDLNITDVIAILRFLFQPGEKPDPPLPYPFPGVDPTEDSLTCDA